MDYRDRLYFFLDIKNDGEFNTKFRIMKKICPSLKFSNQEHNRFKHYTSNISGLKVFHKWYHKWIGSSSSFFMITHFVSVRKDDNVQELREFLDICDKAGLCLYCFVDKDVLGQ